MLSSVRFSSPSAPYTTIPLSLAELTLKDPFASEDFLSEAIIFLPEVVITVSFIDSLSP